MMSTTRNPVVRKIAGTTTSSGRRCNAMNTFAAFSKWLIIGVAIIGVGCVIFLNESLLTVVLQSNESTTKTTTNKQHSPKKCSRKDLKMIQYQLPSKQCIAMPGRTQDCSFSYATKCNDAAWLKNYYIKLQSSREQQQEPSAVAGRIGIVVGCNKAIDAINLLRMLSHNETYNHKTWFEQIQRNVPDVAHGVCGQENSIPFPLTAVGNNNEDTVLHDKTVVHCIEPLPITAQLLEKTLRQLSWSNDQFVIHKVAVSNEDGTILFPSVDTFLGQEGNSISDCFKTPEKCTSVPVFRLDSLLPQYITSSSSAAVSQEASSMVNLHSKNEQQFIDVMSIDAEGFDYEAMLGAPLLLSKTKYLEFEYHYVGNWEQHKLSTVIDKLYNDHNFVCYWAGGKNNLWRITKCFLSYYNNHFWSNVACVNVLLAPDLYQDMEDLFQATLQAGESIRYRGG